MRYSARVILPVVLLIVLPLAASCSRGGAAVTPTASASPAVASGGAAVTPTATTSPAAASAGGRDVVILVHGWLGSPRELLPLKASLDAAGFRSFIAILPGEDNVVNAGYLHDLVDEVKDLTGVQRVNIVGFSMGGLSARYYIRSLGGQGEVERYVSIDTPQYGDPSACLLPADVGGQMCPGSPFLTQLNAGDDTPGDVAYTTILNRAGDIALGRLHGGASEVMVEGAHTELLQMPAVQQAVITALKQK